MTSDQEQPADRAGSTFGQADVVALGDEDGAARVLTGAIQGLWAVVNQLTRLRRTRRGNYRVTIFGSARLAPGTLAYDAVKQLAAELTAMGCDIVTGGGPGLMRAANEGAASADPASRERSVGVRIALPFEQEVNPFVGQVYEHGTFFSRLHHFMIVSGDMWADLVDWGRRWMLRDDLGLADPADFTIPRCVRGVDDTVELIRASREAWLRAQAAP